MTELTDLHKAIIAECTIRVNPAVIVHNGTGYYVRVPRLNRNVEIHEDDIRELVESGYAHKNKYGGIQLDNLKCDSLYNELFVINKIPNPEHAGKVIDVCEFLYSL